MSSIIPNLNLALTQQIHSRENIIQWVRRFPTFTFGSVTKAPHLARLSAIQFTDLGCKATPLPNDWSFINCVDENLLWFSLLAWNIVFFFYRRAWNLLLWRPLDQCGPKRDFHLQNTLEETCMKNYKWMIEFDAFQEYTLPLIWHYELNKSSLYY